MKQPIIFITLVLLGATGYSFASLRKGVKEEVHRHTTDARAAVRAVKKAPKGNGLKEGYKEYKKMQKPAKRNSLSARDNWWIQKTIREEQKKGYR